MINMVQIYFVIRSEDKMFSGVYMWFYQDSKYGVIRSANMVSSGVQIWCYL